MILEIFVDFKEVTSYPIAILNKVLKSYMD